MEQLSIEDINDLLSTFRRENSDDLAFKIREYYDKLIKFTNFKILPNNPSIYSNYYRHSFNCFFNILLLLLNIRTTYFFDLFDEEISLSLDIFVDFARLNKLYVKRLDDFGIIFSKEEIDYDGHPTGEQLGYCCANDIFETPKYGQKKYLTVDFIVNSVQIFSYLCLELDLEKTTKIVKLSDKIKKVSNQLNMKFDLSIVNEERWYIE